jgi:hypothetical protein
MDFLFLYSLFSFLLNDPNIINDNLPSCSRCIHYKKYYFPFVPLNNNLGKCSKFGERNIITGQINYEYAEYVRKDEKKCGTIGKLFEPHEFPYSILEKICEDNCNQSK